MYINVDIFPNFPLQPSSLSAEIVSAENLHIYLCS